MSSTQAVATVRVVEVAAPASPEAAPSSEMLAWRDISAESMREVVGHDDFADPVTALVASHAEQRHATKSLLVAVDPAGTVLGGLWLEMPTDDNTHVADVTIAVRADARRRGIGTALWRAAEERVRAAGRTTASTWSLHAHEAAEGAGAIVPPTGVGRIPADDPAARFLLALGFALEQGERQSTLPVPVPPARPAAWREEARAAAGEDYRLVQWRDATPERWLEQFAELQRRMSVDVPTAGLDFREERWDAARIRDLDEQIARADQAYVLTAVEHVPSGELVAFTHLVMPRSKPEVVYQYNTLVHGDHRGRRLGLLVKAANLELLAREWPAARRVHTWNAGENRHMLAINERMGFRLASVEGAWQIRLTA